MWETSCRADNKDSKTLAANESQPTALVRNMKQGVTGFSFPSASG